MATYTPNLNLEKPDSSDAFGDFRESYNDNMDKIDAGIGSGGGHIIIDPNGTQMAQESGLQFTGGVTVTDDNVNGVTVVDITGGGGGSSVFLNTIYSDTEKRIGYWRDNKPLYQKTLIFQNAQRGRVDNLPHNISDVDFIFVDSWEFKRSSSGIIGFENTNSSYWANLFQITNTAISYRIGESWGAGDLYVNVRYTKTTDTPEPNPQFGNVIYLPTIYSDEERQVGVWRDNKPLYQRTWDISDLSISYNSWTISSIPIGSMETIVNVLAINQNGKAFWGDVMASLEVDATYVSFQTGRNAVNERYRYVTIQYTKTTDTAGSGNWNTDGIPTHHYSTNEQVIGTWIDGKPLYEVMVDGLSINPSTSWSGAFATSLGIKVPVNVTFYNALSGGNPITVFVNEVQQYSGGIRIKVNSSFNPSRTINAMVIQYTKQADYT